ncbi:MAG: type II secretion system F family protein [Nitrospirota bacterium]
MATYSYRAINKESEIIKDRIDASDENQLEEKLGSRGLTLIQAYRMPFQFKTRLRLNEKDLLGLTYFLKMIFASGMSLLDGLSGIGQQSSNTRLSQAASLLCSKIESGKSMYGSMQEHPETFPPIYVSLIKAGEISGNMDSVLDDAMSYLNWKIKMKKDIVSALVYPLMVMTAVFILITVLFVFVLPKLATVLTSMNAELPLVTRGVMAAATLVKNYWPLMLMAALAVPSILSFSYRTPFARRLLDAFVLKIPVIGDLLRKFDHSRYFRTFATLYRSGMSIDKTLRISSSVVKNTSIAATFNSVTNSVLGGELLSKSLSNTGSFTPLIVNMVEIGEKTGALDSSILNISDIYEKEVPETMKKIFVIIEPAIILILGMIVLLTLSSFFLPLYKVIGGIRR